MTVRKKPKKASGPPIDKLYELAMGLKGQPAYVIRAALVALVVECSKIADANVKIDDEPGYAIRVHYGLKGFE